MNNICVSFLLLFVACKTFSQASTSDDSFGEGTISINMFGIPPGVTAINWPDGLEHPFYNFTYYIKGSKIFRKDKENTADATETKSTTQPGQREMTTNLKLRLFHPTYLINWKTKTSYIFFTKNDSLQVSETALRGNTYESFYNRIDSNLLPMQFVENTNPICIAGKKCFEGFSIEKNKDTLFFYYTTDPLSVKSPLNVIAPPTFPYNVLSIKTPTDWTLQDGSKGKGTAIMQVSELKENEPNDSLFVLPKNAIIRKDVSWNEIIKYSK